MDMYTGRYRSVSKFKQQTSVTETFRTHYDIALVLWSFHCAHFAYARQAHLFTGTTR